MKDIILHKLRASQVATCGEGICDNSSDDDIIDLNLSSSHFGHNFDDDGSGKDADKLTRKQTVVTGRRFFAMNRFPSLTRSDSLNNIIGIPVRPGALATAWVTTPKFARHFLPRQNMWQNHG